MAARGAPIWQQIYPTDDWEVARAVIERAQRAGCSAIVLTVDNHWPRYNETLVRAMRQDPRNCTDCHVAAPNIADQLEAAGLSWKAYLQGLPAPCSTVAHAGAGRASTGAGVPAGAKVPSQGVTHLDHTIDSVCPIASTVGLTARMLDVMSGGRLRHGAAGRAPDSRVGRVRGDERRECRGRASRGAVAAARARAHRAVEGGHRAGAPPHRAAAR